MKILVVYGNDEILRRTKQIFDRYACHYQKDSLIGALHYDLIFSLHTKVIFPKAIVESVRCVNIHPGYLPYNRGMFPHVWSIINGLPAGVTIHEMDEKIDNGKILHRREAMVLEKDTSETLYERVLDLEVTALTHNIDGVVHGRIKPFESPEPSNYNSLDDYKKLCKIDPDKTVTFQEAFNLLRALSHGKYKNAEMNGINFKLEIL